MDSLLRDAASPVEPPVPTGAMHPTHVRTRALLGWAQRQFYQRIMQTEISGASWVPPRGGFLVVANHVSHLDAGLVKMALGARGASLHAMAAQDYFFSRPLRRWFFTHLTNVVPIERRGSLRMALRYAVELTQRGLPLLVFPEGTRSVTGQLAPFKPSVSAMAVAANVPILPMYLWGTFEAMPKGGALIPMARRVGATLGPIIPPEALQALMADRSKREGYRLATLAVELAVKSLRERVPLPPQVLVERVLQGTAVAETGPEMLSSIA